MSLFSEIFTSHTTPKNRVLALFSYLNILCLIPLIVNKDDKYVYFHTRQGVILWIWGVIAVFSLHIPVVGDIFFRSSIFLIALLSLFGIVSVFLNRAWRIPLISYLARTLL
ncbi:MAG: hypothetical protein HQL71_07615 [Magnetococcales bacterium]|nr:hypothetical protein [Magnetococcales bacterium]